MYYCLNEIVTSTNELELLKLVNPIYACVYCVLWCIFEEFVLVCLTNVSSLMTHHYPVSGSILLEMCLNFRCFLRLGLIVTWSSQISLCFKSGNRKISRSYLATFQEIFPSLKTRRFSHLLRSSAFNGELKKVF